MEKYFGCNRVSVAVSRPKVQEVKRKHTRTTHFFVRLAVAGALVGVICLAVFAPIPGMSAFRSALKSVFCYDVFGKAVGATPLITGLIGA